VLAHFQMQLAWAMQVLEYAQDWVKSDLVSIACGTSYETSTYPRHAVWRSEHPLHVTVVCCIGKVIMLAIC